MKKNIIFFMILMGGVFISCEEKVTDEPESAEFVKLSEDTLVVGPTGGIVETEIESSGNWRVVGDIDWISPSVFEGKSGEKLTLNIGPNENRNTKEYTYKLCSGSAVGKLTVMSFPEIKLSIVSADENGEMEIAAEEARIDIVVDTNVPNSEYSLSTGENEWITFIEKNNVLGKYVYSFYVKENGSYIEGRETTLTIKAADKIADIKLKQIRKDGVVLEQTTYEYGLEATDISIPVAANFKLSIEEADRNVPFYLNLEELNDGEPDETGLYRYNIVGKAPEADFSRKAVFKLLNDDYKEYARLRIVQRSEKPEWIDVPDKAFRNRLEYFGYILTEDEKSKRCELLPKGKEATFINVGYGDAPFQSLEGIENFPNLESIQVAGQELSVFDISLLHNVTSVTIVRNPYIAEINLGDNNITDLCEYEYDCLDCAIQSESLIIKSSKLERIHASFDNKLEDALRTLDISECPKLMTGYIKRPHLKTIYVTKEQKENGQFEINEGTELVVK